MKFKTSTQIESLGAAVTISIDREIDPKAVDNVLSMAAVKLGSLILDPHVGSPPFPRSPLDHDVADLSRQLLISLTMEQVEALQKILRPEQMILVLRAMHMNASTDPACDHGAPAPTPASDSMPASPPSKRRARRASKPKTTPSP